MKEKAFKQMLKEMKSLTIQQRKVLESSLSHIRDAQAVSQAINEEEKPQCPHCGCKHLNRWGWVNELQRWRCKACKATFNALTGTSLSRLRKKDQWLDVVESLNQTETLDQMQERLNISRKTAVLWRKRFLSAMKNPKNKTLSGIVEADETFVRQSEKGSLCVERPARKRGKPARYGGTHPDDYTCVYTARDRSKEVAHHITPDQKTSVFKDFLKPLVAKDSILCSDGKIGYVKFAKDEGIEHVVLIAKNREFVSAGAYHIQNVNAYHSRLKQMLRRLRGVATKYLGYYLTWLDHLDKVSSQKELRIPLKTFKTCILHS